MFFFFSIVYSFSCVCGLILPPRFFFCKWKSPDTLCAFLYYYYYYFFPSRCRWRWPAIESFTGVPFFFFFFFRVCVYMREKRETEKKKEKASFVSSFFFPPLILRKRADQAIKWRRCTGSEEEAKTKEREKKKKTHTPNCGSFLRISVAFVENGNVSRNVRVKGDLVHAWRNVLRCLWKGVLEQESHRAQKRSSIVLFCCCCFVIFNAS